MQQHTECHPNSVSCITHALNKIKCVLTGLTVALAVQLLMRPNAALPTLTGHALACSLANGHLCNDCIKLHLNCAVKGPLPFLFARYLKMHFGVFVVGEGGFARVSQPCTARWAGDFAVQSQGEVLPTFACLSYLGCIIAAVENTGAERHLINEVINQSIT